MCKVVESPQSDELNSKINLQGCKSYEISYTQNTRKYDLTKEIGNQSNLTRKTTYEILKNIDDNRIKEFAENI